MQQRNKNIIFAIVVCMIVGLIWYLEAHKPPVISGNAPDVVVSPQSTSNRDAVLNAKAQKYSKAKELVDPTGFINTDPFKLSDLVGKKVVLLDFWTYSCINCQRTLPYLEAWYKKYKDQGLVIVGVHTPEFDFEKVYNNVLKATKELGVEYPVVLDSNQGTWSAYQNQYWPHEYLIDIDGYVVDDHIGEGGYADTEQKIKDALKEREQVLGLPSTIDSSITTPQNVIPMDTAGVQSPETYFGSARNEYLGNGTIEQGGEQTLTIPESIQSNSLYLGGTWNFQDQFAESASTATTITYKYSARNVYFVASSEKGVKIRVLLDGASLGGEAGKDVSPDGTAFIEENRLYELVHGTNYGEHTLQIQVEGAGLDAYTFTFG